TTVTGAISSHGRVAALTTSSGDIPADAFVLASGVGSARVASTMGFRLPLYPLKGYSVTFEATSLEGHVPSVSVTDFSRKIVYARLGERLRVAGRVEIVGDDTTVEEERCRSLANEARRLFPAIPADD